MRYSRIVSLSGHNKHAKIHFQSKKKLRKSIFKCPVRFVSKPQFWWNPCIIGTGITQSPPSLGQGTQLVCCNLDRCFSLVSHEVSSLVEDSTKYKIQYESYYRYILKVETNVLFL